MSKIKCILCNSTDSSPIKENTNYRRCSNCKGVFLFPIKEQEYYLNEFNYLTDPETYISLIDPKGFRFLIGHFEKHFKNKTGKERGSVLEIGAGVGYASFMLFSRDWDVEGIETSSPSAEWGRKYLRMPIHNGIIEKFEPKKKFDAVFMVEVLEHFISPKKAIQAIEKMAQKDCLIFGTTPNVDSNYWKIHPEVFNPNDHIFLFNKNSLKFLCRSTKGKDLSIGYFGTKKHNDSNMIFSFKMKTGSSIFDWLN